MVHKLTIDGVVYVPKYVEVNCDTCFREKETCYLQEKCISLDYDEWVIRPSLKQLVKRPQ